MFGNCLVFYSKPNVLIVQVVSHVSRNSVSWLLDKKLVTVNMLLCTVTVGAYNYFFYSIVVLCKGKLFENQFVF